MQPLPNPAREVCLLNQRVATLEANSGNVVVASSDLPIFATVAAARNAVVASTYRRLVSVTSDEENADANGNPLVQTVYYKSSTQFYRIDQIRLV